MYGYLTREGFRVKCFEESVAGLTLLHLQLPRWGSEQQERRGASFLRRVGVHTLLNGTESAGLRLNETGELYRKKAAEIGLCTLRQRHIPAQRAVVGICARRWSREVEQACACLVGQVRALALSMPEKEDYAWRLQRAYGIPVFAGEGDITLCFAPVEAGEGRILLGERRPQVAGLTFELLDGSLEVPDGCPQTALLAALTESGRVAQEQIKVRMEC